MNLLARWGIASLVLTGSPLAFLAQNRTSAPRPFLVTMGEAWSTPQPAAGPVNAMNCVIVFPDGRLHLELRRQEFFEQKAALSIFEGSLDVKEIRILRDLLDAEPIKQLPAFTFMTTLLSGSSDRMQVFSARISRGTIRQQVGYFAPNEQLSADSSAPQEWRDSATALRPLVEWFRALKSAKPRNWRRLSNANSNSCEP